MVLLADWNPADTDGRVVSAPGRYLVRHPLPGEPKVWRVIDAATGR